LVSGCSGVQVGVAYIEADVGYGERCRLGVGVYIFARAEQEKECQDDHVRDGLGGLQGGEGCKGGDASDDLYWNWLDAMGWWILLLPRSL